ncbi:MAG TPA: mannose-1-phosphate guanylyltransferase/mannose-6-phosphate isomerase [Holosporales bacterium]|nr:mannose-1-phosphate guanylyltransferase/mannose-6-phosphate isomerase [Holosporales bacterium]
MKIQPVILCGGSGTRLWPLSRTTYPKQLLAPLGGLSLLQQTVKRFMTDHYDIPMIICNEDYRFLVAEQMQAINVTKAKIILEPCARNTAPAMALASFFVEDLNQPLLFCPSDHQIQNFQEFETCIEKAKASVQENNIVIFGIAPTEPKTGFGYIVPASFDDVFDVKQFVEKPDVEKAKQFIAQKAVWNSGMFYAKASVILDQVKKFLPNTHQYCAFAKKEASKDLDFIRVPKDSFEQCDNISIDYGVIEKSACIKGVACHDIGWSDIGNWESVWALSPKDENQNAFIGDVYAKNVTNSYVRSDGVLVSVLGLDNIVVVASGDAILVADKSKSETIKEMTVHLKDKSRSELDHHKRVYRPWGYYQEVEIGDRFKVKRLMVKSESKTSVQVHYHRSEHWVVVSGTASVLQGDDTKLVHENESVYIPAGMIHAVENPGKIDLHLIEVQSGSYLGEDDIVRIKDIYGRT